MLQINHMSAKYGTLTALQDIDLSIAPGARVGVFGHNGAGKTTLLKCMIGAVPVCEGEVLYDSVKIEPNVPENVKRGIAFVPQGHNVFPNLSVQQNLNISGLLFDLAFIDRVYEIFPVLNERRAQRAGSLSGGEQQMLALGMALMTRPKWLLLDEPSTGLAPVIVRNVMQRLREVNQDTGTALVIVEQNVMATLKIVERAIIIKSSRVVFDGTSQELASNKDLWQWF
jgi:branched-chain amino acid transport system ATP-binding protein